MKFLVRHPDSTLKGSVHIQPSKSMANRLLILDHLYYQGKENIELPDATDSRILRRLLDTLKDHKGNSSIELDVGDGGTTSRFLLAVLCFTEGEFILKGSERLSERPIRELVQLLRELGGNIEGECLPLRIKGKAPDRKDSIAMNIDTSTSSQFASAVLMVLPLLCKQAEIRLTGDYLSLSYIDITIGMMNRFGFKIKREADRITLDALKKTPSPPFYSLEPDYSSISFWVGMVALSKDARVRINAGKFRDSLQADSMMIDRAVANDIITIKTDGDDLVLSSPEKPAAPKSILLDFTDCPDLALPELIMYSALKFDIRFTGVQNLNLKESSRLESLNEGMKYFGMQTIKSIGGYRMDGKFTLPEQIPHLNTFNDHRVAMAFSMLALRTPVVIEDPEVVSKSYPAFWDDLRKLNFEVIQNSEVWHPTL